LVAFALIAGRLFHATVKLSHETAEGQNAAASFNSAIAALRSDVWAARDITVNDPQTATMTLGDGKVIWTIAGTALTRTQGTDADHWEAPAGAAFSVDGAALVLSAPDSRSSRGGEIRCFIEMRIINAIAQR
jgi:hypothetical protein